MCSTTQANQLKDILNKSSVLHDALILAPKLKLPDWYIAAGVISQTVWNYLHNFELDAHIKDIDLVYFDKDTSYEGEDRYIKAGEKLFGTTPIEVEIRNQARVHMWYKNNHGTTIPAYSSTQEAIGSWLTIPTCTGITINNNGKVEIYSPYGVDDLLNMVVRPNKSRKDLNKTAYQEKTTRWKSVWPKLKIIEWDLA